MEVTAIDLGSNTLRVLKYDCTRGERVAEYEKIVRTAEAIEQTGVISHQSLRAIIEGIQEAKVSLGGFSSRVYAVTTEALRIAKNASEVLDTIYKETGVVFEIIDGAKEAKLTLIAVKERLRQLNLKGDFVLIDIGGGSTEVVFSRGEEIYSKSFPLGIVRVANSASSLDEIEEIVAKSLKGIEEFSQNYLRDNMQLLATAGTPTTIAAMKHGLNYQTYDATKINGTVLKLEELDYYLEKLLTMNKKEREIAVGVGRDDLIVAGIVIFKALYRVLNKNRAIVIDDSLREGAAIWACSNL